MSSQNPGFNPAFEKRLSIRSIPKGNFGLNALKFKVNANAFYALEVI